jgi:aspartate aminotransferase
LAPVDPIIGTKNAFLKDKDANKINLGIGAYRDADGNPYVFKIVRKVEENLLKKGMNHVIIQ